MAALYNIEAINKFCQNTLVEHLGIRITDIGEDFIVGTMPVDERHLQPLGYLHGGASVVLAETLGSIASNFLIDVDKKAAFGLEINANHIKSVKKGETLTGRARAIHVGRSTHIWNIEITNQSDNLISVSRLTMTVIDKK